MYDAIVIGGGHNGLTCAAYLARAGRRVLVLESRAVAGGLCTSEETVGEAPGFLMNTAALDLVVTSIPRSVIDELRLADHGFRTVRADPWGAFVNPDGASIALWRDQGRSVAEIARFSRADAERFDRVVRTLGDVWWAAVPYLQGHPTRPGARTIAEAVWRVARVRRSLRSGARLLLSSPEQLIEDHFEREEVKALLANFASWSGLPLQEGGSAAVLAMMATYFRWGARRPVGGAGSFTRALASVVRAHGGEVRTQAPVGKVLVRDGVAHGVVLESGEELYGRQIIGAVDPSRLLGELVDPEFVPSPVQRELRGLGNLRWNISFFKGDVALSRRPELACGREELWRGLLFLAPTMDYVKRAQAAAMRGDLSDEVPMWCAMPSVVDRTQVPEGSEGETLYVSGSAVPVTLSGDRSWAAVKAGYLDHALGVFDGYAPGLEDSVIGSQMTSPADFAVQATRGNIYHADITISQLGPWRPTPSLSAYGTPVRGLWHTGSGAHPVGAVHGWSGRTTARVVDAALRSGPASRPTEGVPARSRASAATRDEAVVALPAHAAANGKPLGDSANV